MATVSVGGAKLYVIINLSSKKTISRMKVLTIIFLNCKSVVPKQYTDEERKALDKRNLLIRKIRFVRKAYLNRFNYFATFTYDSAKHTEHTFKKGLSSALAKLHSRKGWKYMGVWERSKMDR